MKRAAQAAEGTMMQNAANYALDYAARGYQVFPLKPHSKEPATRRGFYDATGNTATLRRWFTGAHPYNIGIRTGVPSGVFVLDIDGEHGADNLARLQAGHGRLPATQVSTTGKGRHFWFTARSSIPNSAGKIAPGIDIRGENGYVVAPPSIHPNGAVYRWENDEPPAEAPPWLIQRALHRPSIAPPIIRPSNYGSSYCKAALEYETRAVATAPRGSRNHALNRASFSLHQLVAVGKLNGKDVVDQLLHAAHRCGLLQEDGKPQVMATIQSGARAGMQCPRRRQS
jgi:hypothetical protein